MMIRRGIEIGGKRRAASCGRVELIWSKGSRPTVRPDREVDG